MVDGINENMYLINAPAGSGKTTKIRSMLDEHLRKNPQDNILCITYTNRAAEELGKDINSNHIFFGTIHAFINQFVNSFFSHQAVIDLYWEIYEEKIKERIENVDRKDNIEESNQRYIEKYGKLDADTVYNNLTRLSYGEAPYTSLYRGALSHDDLISFARKMVDRFPVIKRKIAEKYQVVFIDEYQDTSADVLHIFYEAMKNGKGKLYLLGDKMQQIYKTYDGSFENEFLTLDHSLKLTTNYRTTPHIVSVLNYIYNDKAYEQIPCKKNKDESMDYPPEVIITSDPEAELKNKKEIYPKALVLYLLNRDRFCSIGAGSLYEKVQQMEQYQFGKKYSPVDVLTDLESTNQDKLFLLLFLMEKMHSDYRNNLFGKVIQLIKKNKKILNASKYTIREHSDKSKLNVLLNDIMNKFEDKESTIKDFLLFVNKLDLVNAEYLEDILTDNDYEMVLDSTIDEFHNLTNYLNDPHISTQHGVKGESHDTVIFMAANNNRTPIVNMSGFFKLWSLTDVKLADFDKFYYEYRELIFNINQLIGMKSSDMKAEQYRNNENKILELLKKYQELNEGNNYYECLLKDKFDKLFEKPGSTRAQACLKENLVYGVLSAYRLFYVGCSRARKNLTIIINSNEISDCEDKLVSKFKQCGFCVTKCG